MKPVQPNTTGVLPLERLCPRCGTELGGFGPEGLCAVCLLDSGLAAEELTNAPPRAAFGRPRFGDYELLEEIARGGMGVVHRARQVSLNRIVALKTMLGGAQAGAEDVRRFRVEAEAAAQLKHPNIVAIHEVGERDGQPFFSMDFIEGQTLRQLTRDNPLPARDAAALLKTVAEAVHYAHEHGVVHRDLKPSNVLVDAAGQPHITDFGLAKRIDGESDLTVSGLVMGTPGYMPPEQAAGQTKTIGPATDVYALGAVLYDLLTGRPPFRAATPMETAAQVMKEEPVAPRLLNAAVPRDLETICLKCLGKEPSRRYASALALAEDLARHLNHEPIRAVPPSAIYRARKFVRRHRVGVAVAAGFVLVLLGATVVSARFGWRADREREAALKAKTETERARVRASENAHEARAAQTNTQKVLTFFRQRILAAARPVNSGGLGRTVTIREAVAAAESDIANAFTNYPLAEGAIRGAIGQTYIYLGESSNAVRQLEGAVESFRTVGGSRSDQTLAAMDLLGLAYSQVGRFDRAAKLHEQVVAEFTAIYGWDHSNTVMSAHNLAAAFQYLGRPREAVELFERVLKWRRAHLGPEDASTLTSLRALADAHRANRNLSTAIAMLEECYAVELRTTATNDLGVLGTMGSLANAYQENGQADKALPLRQENLRRREFIQGPAHRDTLSARHNLATTYRQVGHLDEAIALHKSTLELRRKVLGVDHPHTLYSLQGLARTYEDAERKEEAAPLYQEAARLREERLGKDHPDTLSSLNALAMLYIDLARAAEAVPLSETVVGRAQRSLGVDHPDTVVWTQDLARSYKAAGRLSEAIPLFQECLARFETNRATRVADKLTCMHNLAGAFGLAGDWPRAAALFEETVKLQSAALGERHKHTLASVDNLASAWVRAEEFGRAEGVLAGLLRTQRLMLPAESKTLAATLVRLGEARLQQGKFAEAEAPLREAVKAFERKQPGLSPFFTAQCLLGWSLLEQKKLAEAQLLLTQGQAGLAAREAESPSSLRASVLRNTVERLARLYEAQGKPDEAARWREKLK